MPDSFSVGNNNVASTGITSGVNGHPVSNGIDPRIRQRITAATPGTAAFNQSTSGQFVLPHLQQNGSLSTGVPITVTVEVPGAENPSLPPQ